MECAKADFRTEVGPDDIRSVREIVSSTNYFTPAEIEVAVELVEERLRRGEQSGYFFVFALYHDRTVGYACFGPIACTVNRFDLYWVAVEKQYQNQGLGSLLLVKSEQEIRRMGGRKIYIETSSQPKYEPTRTFYTKQNYFKEAEIRDFYNDNDNKIIYVKTL